MSSFIQFCLKEGLTQNIKISLKMKLNTNWMTCKLTIRKEKMI